MSRWVSSAARGAVALTLLAGAVVAPGAGQTVAGAAGSADPASVPPGAQVAYDEDTGTVRYLTTPRGKPLRRPPGVSADAAPETAARAFLRQHGALFGLDRGARDLRTLRARTEGPRS